MDDQQTRAMHVVLTRFNVVLDASRAAPPEEWLRGRLDLFTRYTLPSMLTQSVAPDRWLIFCDDASPAWFRRSLEDAVPSWAQIVWVQGPFHTDRVSLEVARVAGGRAVVTTRLDNDDCVARDFVASVQQHVVPDEPYFLNFTVGSQYQDGRFYHRLDPSNAFISYVEPASAAPPRTVLLDSHNRLGRHGRVEQVRTHPMWLQIVHGGNQANVIQGVSAPPDRVLRWFGVPFETARTGRVAIALDTVRTTARMTVRVVSRPRRIAWLLRSLGAPVGRRRPARMGPGLAG